MTDANSLLQNLSATKKPIGQLSAPPEPGIYALFAGDGSAIPGISGDPDRPIYIGSSTNLAQREFETHFRSTSTGFSTIRRTLGALLEERLDLVARPRGQGKTRQDFYCYRFELDGEDRLTDWMTANIHVAVQPTGEYVAAERELTGRAQPPLNLSGWANPDAVEIKRRSKACADEARRASAPV
jgi:GIY-YIG catalytic domain